MNNSDCKLRKCDIRMWSAHLICLDVFSFHFCSFNAAQQIHNSHMQQLVFWTISRPFLTKSVTFVNNIWLRCVEIFKIFKLRTSISRIGKLLINQRYRLGWIGSTAFNRYRKKKKIFLQIMKFTNWVVNQFHFFFFSLYLRRWPESIGDQFFNYYSFNDVVLYVYYQHWAH